MRGGTRRRTPAPSKPCAGAGRRVNTGVPSRPPVDRCDHVARHEDGAEQPEHHPPRAARPHGWCAPVTHVVGLTCLTHPGAGQGVDRQRTGPGACAPANTSTPLVGERVVIKNAEGERRASFVLEAFEQAGPDDICWSLFRDVHIRGTDASYRVAIGSLLPAVMTRDQLVSAESPDAYAGIAFLVSDCAVSCTARVKTAIELSDERTPSIESFSSGPS